MGRRPDPESTYSQILGLEVGQSWIRADTVALDDALAARIKERQDALHNLVAPVATRASKSSGGRFTVERFDARTAAFNLIYGVVVTRWS